MIISLYYHFAYTPTNEINRTGYSVWTGTQYLFQHVFWSATNCIEYKTPMDVDGAPLRGNTTTKPCSTYAPGSGTIESYTTYVHAGELREAMWRNGVGYIRDIPLKSDGSVDWMFAPTWTPCCNGNGPSEQGAYVIGDELHQHVFWSANDCTEYITPFDDNGNPIWGNTSERDCFTSAPGSEPIESYTTYVHAGALWEAMWSNGVGYIRDIPLLPGTTIVGWFLAPDWTPCCYDNGPSEQGAYMLPIQ